MPNKILAGYILKCYCQTTLSKILYKMCGHTGQSDDINLLYIVTLKLVFKFWLCRSSLSNKHYVVIVLDCLYVLGNGQLDKRIFVRIQKRIHSPHISTVLYHSRVVIF